MYSLRVVVGSALLVVVQTTIIRRSIINSTTSQNPTNISSTLPSSTRTTETLGVTTTIEGANTTATAGITLDESKLQETRRLIAKERSTSSSSGARSRESGSRNSVDKESLEISSSTGEDTDSQRKYKEPKATRERKGWRKWHRKCTPCFEEMKMKWRNPSIKWICGGYQRARRSFKSSCMMYYRNCQDGTMFVKLHDHRCADDDKTNNSVVLSHGDHLLYDYRVVLSGDDSDEQDRSSSTESESETTSESE